MGILARPHRFACKDVYNERINIQFGAGVKSKNEELRQAAKSGYEAELIDAYALAMSEA